MTGVWEAIKSACFPRDHHMRPSLTWRELAVPIIPRALAIYAVRLVLVWVLKRRYRQVVPVIPEKEVAAKAHRASLYILSFVNALVCSTHYLRYVTKQGELQRAALNFAQKMGKSAADIYNTVPQFETKEQYTANLTMLRHLRETGLFFMGYIVHDLASILPQWRDNISDVIHHVLSIAGVSLMLKGPLTMSPMYLMPTTMLEISTLPLNLRWFAKEIIKHTSDARLKAGLERVSFYSELAFAASFTFVRIIRLPKVAHFDHKRDIPYAHSKRPFGANLLWVFYVLQLYWFSSIAKKVAGQFGFAKSST